MASYTRRTFLRSTAAAGVGGSLAVLKGTPASADGGAGSTAVEPSVAAHLPSDDTYYWLVNRGLNQRFRSTPDVAYQVFSAEQTRIAVQRAVSARQHIAVRSGGHCLDRLVDDDTVRALIDVSRLTDVYFDRRLHAFSVGAGALLGDVYKSLYSAHGVIIPGGTCPTVGVGGYVTGGGFGALSRQHGLIVDHLYGVEVVVCDERGRARRVVATRRADDPNRDLWWAHAGGGGGSFGVATRFLFRTPGVRGDDPSTLLPKPPRASLVTSVRWPWATMTEQDFARLVRNHNAWHADHSGPGSSFAALFSSLMLGSRRVGTITLVCQIDADEPDAPGLVRRYVAALCDGVAAERSVEQRTMPWLSAVFANLYGGSTSTSNRSKTKGAYHRHELTDRQIHVLYDALADPGYDGSGVVVLYSYGCAVNAVDESATAVAQRDSILKLYYGSSWADAAADERHVAWVRALYRNVYAATGGVPVPGGATDGSYINYPDVDLRDPRWNSSSVSWSSIYFKNNYGRLQRVKRRYDPLDVFHHPLSVRP